VNITPSISTFERLKLNLLRNGPIKEILERTFMTNQTTICIGLGLNGTDALKAAENLFNQTNGHPRSLLRALEQCNSLNDLLGYKEPLALPGSDWKKFYDGLVQNKDAVLKLLSASETKSTINMMEIFADSGGRGVPLDVIANNSCVAWEGTAEKAQVYIHPFVKLYMEGWLMPFTDYVRCIGSSSEVSVDYPNAFEWMFIK